MELLKKIIIQIIPPFIISLYNTLKRKFNPIPFSGVHDSADYIRDENPWVQEKWIEVSRNKLNNIRRVSSDSFMPTPDFQGYPVILCLIANILSHRNKCNLIDFGGGTGFIYFLILPYLHQPENVIYHVVDSNLELFRIGQEHAKHQRCENQIVFHTKIPQKDFTIDLLYINTTLQYIYDYPSVLSALLQRKPKYAVLTRLLTGDMKTFITSQNVLGFATPCVFINVSEIINIFLKYEYDLIFKSPCTEEVLEGAYDKNIPEHFRIHNTANLVFHRRKT